MAEIQKELSSIVNRQYVKAICADLTDDDYQVLECVDSQWKVIDRMFATKKISEWFTMFCKSPVLYNDDKKDFMLFTDLNYLRQTFAENNNSVIRIIYRRQISNEGFHPALMEIVPRVHDNAHLMAYIFVRDISETYDSISRKVSSDIRNNILPKSFSGTKKTVLVIEDDSDSRNQLCSIISDKYNIIEADNVRTGFDLLMQEYQEISIILLNVNMPLTEVYDFIKEVSKSNVLNSIPIVVMTASEESDVEEKCLELGAADFIQKPYNPIIVLSRIASLIRLRESISALLDIEFDDQTGVYTKEAFYHHAGRMIASCPNDNYTLMICDIEQFKLINTVYGKTFSDSLLVDLGNSLKRDYREGAIIGRIGGDIFAILSYSKDNIAIDENLAESYSNIESLKKVNAVVKFALYENIDTSLTFTEICDRTLRALNYVKHNYNVTFTRYDDNIEQMINRQAMYELSMREALIDKQFVVYYQPKHIINTGELCGAEALVRWNNPEYGFLLPGEFIPLFEKTGFVTEIDRFVWKTVCENQRRWLNMGLEVVPISVNQSKMDFDSNDLFEFLSTTAKIFNVPAELLHLEITESLFSGKITDIISTLDKCRKFGFQVEMDDFGSGYSSLNILGELPLDIVKLDMSFMKRINDTRRTRVLEACIKLAHALNLSTVCEGVENKEQIEVLKKLDADTIQGYYYSEPISAEEFERYLKKYRSK